MWLGVLTRVLSVGLGLWLLALLFVAYHIAHPGSSCAKDQDPRACYEPLIHGNTLVSVEFFASTGSNARAIDRPGSNTRRLFKRERHTLSTPLSSSFEVRLDADIRVNGKKLFGYLNISSEERMEVDDLRRQQYHVILGPIELTKTMQSSNHLWQQTRSLLDPSNSSAHPAGGTSSAMRPHFKYLLHPLTIRYVDLSAGREGGRLRSPELPVLMHSLQAKYIQGERGHRGSRVYEPLLYVDEVSLLSSHWREISRDVSQPSPKMTITIVPTSVYIFAFKKYMEVVTSILGDFMSDAEIDEFRWMISDDRIFVFVLTNIITALHVLFEYLAFCNDYQFFVGSRRRRFRAISKSSLVFSVAQSAVIFLYLLDGGTSKIVLLGVLKDAVYGAYKVYVVLLRRSGDEVVAQTIADGPSDENEDDDGRTDAYDASATAHLLFIIAPLFVGFSAFCLRRYQYKSWWSWLVSCLADGFYFVGFAHMLPQIYINYRLRSVAHLPVRALMYKGFNTFIDDVFAFAVTMPLKHRLMTLRDDVVFLLFLYQWFVYPSDKSRPNEFGFRYRAKGGDGEKAE